MIHPLPLLETLNIKKGELINFSFEAETITFGKLIKITDLDEYKRVFVKIDIEGAEYELFDSL